jgi:rhodanese-related sulfurtransferase
MIVDRYSRFRAGLAAFTLMLAGVACSSEPVGPELSAPEAYQRVQSGQLTLIDIRRPEEWRQTGVAAGAVGIDMRRADFGQAVLNVVGGDVNAPIGIICRTGNRTTAIHQAMQEAGFKQVYNVREGMAGGSAGPGWVRQGLPVEACKRC